MSAEEIISIMTICCAVNLICAFLQWNRGNTKTAILGAILGFATSIFIVAIKKGIIS